MTNKSETHKLITVYLSKNRMNIVDKMVEAGYYHNRSTAIRQAIEEFIFAEVRRAGWLNFLNRVLDCEHMREEINEVIERDYDVPVPENGIVIDGELQTVRHQ